MFTRPLQVKNLFIIFALTFSSVCAQADTAMPITEHQLWQKLLQRHLVTLPDKSSTQVDYNGFASDAKLLESYLAALADVNQASFDTWDTQDQLAFLLNAYNAWTVKLVVDKHDSINSIKDLGSLFISPWKKSFIPLLGKTRSLDEIEHDMIRGSGRYQDPRIHFGANCASIGCPALREEAYVGNTLDAQLEQQARRFLGDQTRNRLQGDHLQVSAIFKWYRADFEKGWRGAMSLPDFFVLYAKELRLDATEIKQLQAGDIPISYLDYDWRLNRK